MFKKIQLTALGLFVFWSLTIITPATRPTYADVGGPPSPGLDLSGITQSAIDKVGGWQAPTVNPQITCDGVTDSAPAINAAIGKLESTAPYGGFVRLPACDRIAIASEIHVSKSNVHIVGAGRGEQSTPVQLPSSYFKRSTKSKNVALTVIGYTGTCSPTQRMVRFEPNAGDQAMTGSGIEGAVLAGMGCAGVNLDIETDRNGVFDVTLEDGTAGSDGSRLGELTMNVTTNALAHNEFCDTQSNRFYNLIVVNYPNATSVGSQYAAIDTANGVVLDGRVFSGQVGGGVSIPPGCDNTSENEVNTSSNYFYNPVVKTMNGNGWVFYDAVDNFVYGPRITQYSGATSGKSMIFSCATNQGWQSRRNAIYGLQANGPIASNSCSTSFRGPQHDSATQNRLYEIVADPSANTQKPVFSGNWSPDASMFWSATDGDGNYIKPGGAKYISNDWYLGDTGMSGKATNGIAPGANTIVCQQYVFGRATFTAQAFGVRISTADAAGHVQAAWYSDSNGVPGTLIGYTPTSGSTASTGVVSMATNTIPSSSAFATVAGPGTFYGRTVWGCVSTDSATAAFGTFDVNVSQATLVGSSSLSDVLTAPVVAKSTTGTFGTWPTTLAGPFVDVITNGYAAVAAKAQ